MKCQQNYNRSSLIANFIKIRSAILVLLLVDIQTYINGEFNKGIFRFYCKRAKIYKLILLNSG